jgi:hypothetical protein
VFRISFSFSFFLGGGGPASWLFDFLRYTCNYCDGEIEWRSDRHTVITVTASNPSQGVLLDDNGGDASKYEKDNRITRDITAITSYEVDIAL